MTMNVSSICRGFRAPSELAQAAGGYQTPWTFRFLQEFWQWLTGVTQEINGFTAALPAILIHLEVIRRANPEGLAGFVTMYVWLNDRQTLRLHQTEDGLRLYVTLVTRGERDLVSERVERLPGSGSMLQQLHVKVAREFLSHSIRERLHESPHLEYLGNFSEGRQNLRPFALTYTTLFDVAIDVLGDAQTLSASDLDVLTPATDVEIALRNSHQTALSEQQRSARLRCLESRAEEIFAKNTPSAGTSTAVRTAIQCKLDGLSSKHGLQNSCGDIVSLVGGADVISATEFDKNDEETEWCLLRSGSNTYTFMTIDAARGLMQSTQLDPFNRAPITADSFIRGEELLKILQTLPDDSPVITS